ncbi:DUF1989 domain-containing protein [Anaerotruncus colihominis]|nr:DUF1989 domain-containing protein [Anaerotruncus colihominis]
MQRSEYGYGGGADNFCHRCGGWQVADFFAECAGNPHEFLSPAVTVDCNESLKLHVGDYIYTNLYRPMFKVVLSPIRCKTLLDGGRRRTKNLYGVFKRTVPAGQVRQ